MTSNRSFSIIAAVTKNWGLGYQGHLPWVSFKEDMDFFRKTTAGATVIMGRKTFESLGEKPLPERQNLVVTQMKQIPTTQLAFVPSLEAALAQSEHNRPIWLIGGVGIYEQGLNMPGCQRVLLTHVDLKLPVDVHFPALPADQYALSEVIQTGKTEYLATEPVKYEILAYDRRPGTGFDRSPEKIAGPSCWPTIRNEAGYLSVLQNILDFGEDRTDRTGVGTRSLFGVNFRYDLQAGFPLLTTKRMFWKGIAEELLWFLRGQTDSKILEAKGVNIWTGNTSRAYLDSIGLDHLREGDGGAIYGFNLRHWGAQYENCDTDYAGQGFDQIKHVIDLIKNDPTSRRILFTMYNPGMMDKMSLPPCHILYQFYVSEEKYLSCSMYQRSGDMGLGVPFNIASSSLLTWMLAHLTGLQPKELVHTVGDCHLYLNHLEAVQKQIRRTPRPWPQLKIQDRGQQDPADFTLEDFQIQGYWPYPGIKMPMAV